MNMYVSGHEAPSVRSLGGQRYEYLLRRPTSRTAAPPSKTRPASQPRDKNPLTRRLPKI